MNSINATQAYAGHSAEAAYSRWAPIYDLVFDLPFHPGRAAAARAAAERRGARRRDPRCRRGHRARTAASARQRAGDRHRYLGAHAARGARAGRAKRAGAGQGPPCDGRRRARISRRGVRRRARALRDERRSQPGSGARRGLAGSEAGRDPDRHELFRGVWRPSRGRSSVGWKRPPPGSGGIRTSPIPRSETGSIRAPTHASSSAANSRR